MLTINALKVENEQLLENAESEIKRMSEFVDKFTSDAEANKIKIVTDFEQKLASERAKGEEAKRQLAIEKGDIELKYTMLVKEAEALKQENMSL
jgi:hypothetical protein